MECDPTRVCELLVGLGDVEVLGVDGEADAPLRVHVRRRAPRPLCVGCGGPLWSNGERPVELVDLPAFGRAVRLVWHKRRWRCAQRGCSAGAVTEQDGEIVPRRERLTTRAGRWATRQAGRGRPVQDVASELGCSWHPVNMSVRRWGEALLDADTERIRGTEALGLDEHLMWRRGRFRTKAWATSIVDVGRGQLLDIVAGWAALCGAGDTRSPTGTPPESPTPPPRPSTTWPNASNAPPSGSPTSTTTGSGHCCMPANPTGHSSTPSLHPETRRAPQPGPPHPHRLPSQQQTEPAMNVLRLSSTRRWCRELNQLWQALGLI